MKKFIIWFLHKNVIKCLKYIQNIETIIDRTNKVFDINLRNEQWYIDYQDDLNKVSVK